VGVFRGYARGKASLNELRAFLYRRLPAWLEGALCALVGSIVVLLFHGDSLIPFEKASGGLFLLLVPVFWMLMMFVTPRYLLYALCIALSLGVLTWEMLGGQ
jgi:hypothetical protein